MVEQEGDKGTRAKKQERGWMTKSKVMYSTTRCPRTCSSALSHLAMAGLPTSSASASVGRRRWSGTSVLLADWHSTLAGTSKMGSWLQGCKGPEQEHVVDM